MAGGGIMTLLKNTVGGGADADIAGGVMGRGLASESFGSGVAIEGGRPKSTAEVGSGTERDGGLVGGLEEWRELEPEPVRSGNEEYGAAERRALRISDGADVINEDA